MKIVCDCGHEEIFNTVDQDTGEQTDITENEGQYATIENFDLWEMHDVVGIVCKKCKKAIWLFT